MHAGKGFVFPRTPGFAQAWLQHFSGLISEQGPRSGVQVGATVAEGAAVLKDEVTEDVSVMTVVGSAVTVAAGVSPAPSHSCTPTTSILSNPACKSPFDVYVYTVISTSGSSLSTTTSRPTSVVFHP